MRTEVCAEIECKSSYIEWTRLTEERTLALRNQGIVVQPRDWSKATSTLHQNPGVGTKIDGLASSRSYIQA